VGKRQSDLAFTDITAVTVTAERAFYKITSEIKEIK
jgi:hypothetical protein